MKSPWWQEWRIWMGTAAWTFTSQGCSSCCHCQVPNLLSAETNAKLLLCYYLFKSPPATWWQDDYTEPLPLRKSQKFMLTEMDTYSGMGLPFLPARCEPALLFKDLKNVWSIDVRSDIIHFRWGGKLRRREGVEYRKTWDPLFLSSYITQKLKAWQSIGTSC